MIGERVEDRVRFTPEFKNKILLKTNGRCARCGCELNTDNQSVEHILPISHGGTNDLSNLLMLCIKCNQKKADKVYYPGDYYTYYTDECGGLNRMTSIVIDWFRQYKDEFWFEKYPLISPVASTEILLGIKGKTYRSGKYLDIIYASDARKQKFSGEFSEWLDNTPQYIVLERGTNKLIAVLSITYISSENKKKGLLAIRVLKANTGYKGLYAILSGIVPTTVDRYHNIGMALDMVSISYPYEELKRMIDAKPLSTTKMSPGTCHMIVGDDEFMTVLSYGKDASDYIVKNFRIGEVSITKMTIGYIVEEERDAAMSKIKKMFGL